MLTAIVADFQRLSDVETVTLLDKTLPNDVGHVCHRSPTENEWSRFREIAGQCDYTLVIAPEFDELLEIRSQAVLDARGQLLGSLPEAIRLTADKLATADFWQQRGVRHPRTAVVESVTFAAFPGPWVMKPRFGAGSQATFLIRNRGDELNAWSPAFHECPDEEFIVQPYVRGQAASVALLMSATQTIPLLPARQHLSRDGRFRYQGGSLPLPETLAERAIQLALTAVAGINGLQGYVGVDLTLGVTGEDYAIEINPRLTTSYLGLRQLCQQNLAELMLRMAQGETINPPTWSADALRFGCA